MWTNKPVSPVFPHHNLLINELSAQAGDVIIKRLKNQQLDLMLRYTRVKRLILGRNEGGELDNGYAHQYC